MRISDRWRDIPLDYYVYREDSALARPLFGVTPDMMETYTRLTGVPYPWNKYAQVTVADFIGGMENVERDHAGGLAARSPAPTATGRGTAQSLIPHELAHQWFGNLVTAENWANYWLNEGHGRVHAGPVLGREAGPRTRRRTTTSRSTGSTSTATPDAGRRSPPTTPATCIPRARWCWRC